MKESNAFKQLNILKTKRYHTHKHTTNVEFLL
jgi:hypothetical protein